MSDAPQMAPLGVTRDEAARLRRLLSRKIVLGGELQGKITEDVIALFVPSRAAAAAPGDESQVVRCLVRKAGGGEGGPSTACTFVYNLYAPAALDDATVAPFATAVAPYCGRAAYGKYIAAPDNSFALAIHGPPQPDGSPSWLLMACKEIEDVTPCGCL